MNIIYFSPMPLSKIQAFSISTAICLLFFPVLRRFQKKRLPPRNLIFFWKIFQMSGMHLTIVSIKLEDMNITLNDDNQSGTDLIASLNFPLNWTEFQYREESDFFGL